MSDDLDIAGILQAQRLHAEAVAKTYGVTNEIHSKDMLFDFLVRAVFRAEPAKAVDTYFSGGEDCCKRFASVYAEAGKKGGSVLEFASGYGRVARHARKLMPDVQWVCCDIHPEAVEFNEWTVGVRAMASLPNPADFDAGGKTFDAVFALSFFSHMPDATFAVWLGKLFDAVAVDGILAFTTHGEVTARNMRAGGMPAAFNDAGYIWNFESDQRDLDSSDYGTSVVTFDYVWRAIEGLSNQRLIRFQEAFWWGHQDLYVVRRQS